MQKTKKLTIAIILAVALLLTVIFAFSPAGVTRADAQAQASAVVEQDMFNVGYNTTDGKCVSTYFPNGYINTKKNVSASGVNNTWSYHDTAISVPSADYSDLTQIWIEIALVNGAYDNSGNTWDQLTIATVDKGGDIGVYTKRANSAQTEGDDSVGTLRASSLGGATSASYTQGSYNTRFWNNDVRYYVLDLANKTDVEAGNWFEFYNQNPAVANSSDATFTQKDLAGIIFRTHNDNNNRNEYNYGAIYGKKSDGSFVRLFNPAHATIVSTSVQGKTTWNSTADCVMENPNIQASGTTVNEWYDVTVNEGKYTITSAPSNNWSNWWDAITFSKKDLSDYNGFSFYVDNTLGNIPVHLNIFIRDAGGSAKWFNAGETSALFVPTTGTPYIADIRILKAGFKGTVYATFAGNGNGAFVKSSTNGVFGLNFYITNEYAPTSFILRDFKFTSSAEKYLETQYVQNPDGTYTLKGVKLNAVDGTKVTPQAVEEVVGEEKADEYVSHLATLDSKLTDGVAENLSNVTTYYNLKDAFALPEEFDLGSLVSTNASQVSISGDTVTVQKAGAINSWTGVTLTNKIPTNSSRYNGISFYVDLSSNVEPIFFNKYVQEDTNDGWNDNTFHSNYGAAMYYPEEGTPEYANNGAEYSGNINTIPAGFKGTVVVPFSSFGNNGGVAKDHKLDLTNVRGVIGLTFDRGVGGGSFVLKDFKLVSNAKVYVAGSAFFQKRDGDFGEANSLNTMSGRRVAVLAGSNYEIPTTVTIGGVEYVLDEARSKIDPTDASNYNSTGHVHKMNPVIGTENLTGDEKNWGMGCATWNYNPQVYYVYRDAFVVEKVFGLDEIRTSFPKGTTAESVLAQFPVGAVSVGNDKGGFMQISGEWRIEQASAGFRVYFVSTNVSANYLDPDGLLEYAVEVSTVDKQITAIEVTEPLKTSYVKGENFSNAGLTVTAIYDDGTTETIDISEVTISGFNGQTEGEQTITVSYGNFSDTFVLRVVDAVVEIDPEGSNGVPVTSDSGCTSASVATVLAILGALGAVFVIKRRA